MFSRLALSRIRRVCLKNVGNNQSALVILPLLTPGSGAAPAQGTRKSSQ